MAQSFADWTADNATPKAPTAPSAGVPSASRSSGPVPFSAWAKDSGIDLPNLDMPLPGGARKSFGDEFAASLEKQNDRLMGSQRPSQGTGESTVSQDTGENHLNSLQEAILLKSLNPDLAKNPLTGFLGDAFDTVKEAVTNTPHLDAFVKGLGSHVVTDNGAALGSGGEAVFGPDGKPVMKRNATGQEEVGNLIGSAADIGNVAFAPIAGVFKGAESIPVAGSLFKGFNWLVGKGMGITEDMINSYIGLLPISQEAKDQIGKPTAQVLTLLAAAAAGDAVHDKVPEIRSKLADIQKTVTKDIITTYNVPKTIKLTSDQVKNHHESQGIRGGATMTPEETQAFKDMGLTGKKYVDALWNGTTIDIPAEKVVTIMDKPYWAKVKGLFSNEFFSFDSIPESVTNPLGNVSEGVAGFLPEGRPEGAPILDTPTPDGVPPRPPIEGIVQGAIENAPRNLPPSFSQYQKSIVRDEEPESRYPESSDIIDPQYTDDIEFYDNVKSDVVDNPDRTSARESAVGKIDEIMGTRGIEGTEMLRMVVDRFGKTEARRIFREGIATDTMTPKQMNNFFDSQLKKLDEPRPERISKPVAVESSKPSVVSKNTLVETVLPVGESPERGTSKIAKSVDVKAVEAGLTKGFKDLAGYDKVKVKEQAERAVSLLTDDFENARAVLRGEADLPSGLKGVAVIKAFEDYLKNKPDADLAYEIANSPLISGTSEAAQELRLARERDPDSVTSKLQEIRKVREERAGKPKVERARKISKDLIEASKKINLPKEELQWDNFLESITC